MQQSPHNLIAIIGPTASGKSDLAIALAKQYDGEVISADSRQVYRGMDIGTGKVTRDFTPSHPELIEGYQKFDRDSSTRRFPARIATRSVAGGSRNDKKMFYSEGIRHHLIDVASPKREYNIAHFLRDAKQAIADIERRGKLPIICGGTHFWIQALLEHQTLPEVKPNKTLRAKLETKSVEELFLMLEEKDPDRAETIDRKNKIRLVRALEICEAIGKVPSIQMNQESRIKNQKLLILALNPDKEILRERIRLRLEKRFSEGMIKEVERLHENGVSYKRLENFGLEYRFIARFLRKKISETEMKEKLFFEIWHYAKRQLSWLRRWEKQGAKIHWIKNQEEATRYFEDIF